MQWHHRLASAVLLAAATISPVLAAPATGNPAFQRTWERYDEPLFAGRSDRSWTWGPAPLTTPSAEEYNGANRTVQYFDKGRMEMNNPAADTASPWFVTSGHLPYELMTGRRQRSDDTFADWQQSYLAAIGDPNTFPAYPDLLTLYQKPGTLDPARLGKPATEILNPDMSIGAFTVYADDPATVLTAGANGHGVPQAFKAFQEQRGLIFQNGQLVQGQVYDPTFIFGLPLTPAVWVEATIGGMRQPVLFQVFERRVLTYQPTNPAAFRVQMGNVGQHYLRWKDQPELAMEWGAAVGEGVPVVSPIDPNVVYTLEVEWREEPFNVGTPGEYIARYGRPKIYRSTDGGRTRELRSVAAEELGQHCRWSGPLIQLRVPGPATPSSDRVTLFTQCSDSPSPGRGAGARTATSYDGGRTFHTRILR